MKSWPKLIAEDLLRGKHGGAYASYAYFIRVDGKRFTCTLCNTQQHIRFLRKHVGRHWNIIHGQLLKDGLIKPPRRAKQARYFTITFKCNNCGYTVKYRHPLNMPPPSIQAIRRKLRLDKCPRCGRSQEGKTTPRKQF